jgi:hypothetical protein
MLTNAKYRVCIRCGTRETLRHFGTVLAWEEMG